MPCVEETCTIEGNELNPVTGELIINAKLLDPSTGSQGGIACGSQGGADGMFAQRYLSQAPVAPPAGTAVDLIGMTTAGDMYSNQTLAKTVHLGDGALVAIGNDGIASSDSLDVTYTNTSGRTELVQVVCNRNTASLRTTNATTPPTREAQYEYRGVMILALDVADITGGFGDRQRVDTGPNLFKTDGRDIIRSKKLTAAVRLVNGASVRIETFIDTDTRTNLINLGFQSRENYLIIHPTA